MATLYITGDSLRVVDYETNVCLFIGVCLMTNLHFRTFCWIKRLRKYRFVHQIVATSVVSHIFVAMAPHAVGCVMGFMLQKILVND